MAAIQWRKSTRSTSHGNCVEVAFAGGEVRARDSKVPDEAHLAFSPLTWAAFVGALRGGHFDHKID